MTAIMLSTSRIVTGQIAPLTGAMTPDHQWI